MLVRNVFTFLPTFSKPIFRSKARWKRKIKAKKTFLCLPWLHCLLACSRVLWWWWEFRAGIRRCSHVLLLLLRVVMMQHRLLFSFLLSIHNHTFPPSKMHELFIPWAWGRTRCTGGPKKLRNWWKRGISSSSRHRCCLVGVDVWHVVLVGSPVAAAAVRNSSFVQGFSLDLPSIAWKKHLHHFNIQCCISRPRHCLWVSEISRGICHNRTSSSVFLLINKNKSVLFRYISGILIRLNKTAGRGSMNIFFWGIFKGTT